MCDYIGVDEPPTVLTFAIRNNNVNINLISSMIDKSYGYTPLHIACQNGDTNEVEKLLKDGANVNETNVHGETPLHIACGCDGRETINMEIIKLLIYHNADHTIKDFNRDLSTPLDYLNEEHTLIVDNFIEGRKLMDMLKCPDE